MDRKSFTSALIVLVFIQFNICESIAQDSTGQMNDKITGFPASGTFEPSGPPLEQPVRVDAGKSCIVDLKQAYTVSGTISGSMEIDYRIIVFGPCESPPVLGKYDEEWIAHGIFKGEINGSVSTGNLQYTANVQAGGDVDGLIIFDGEFAGELTVSDNFSDGELTYKGWTN